MVALNQGKIIKALEKLVSEPTENFIFGFLKAYDISSATITRLKKNDPQRNVARASYPGHTALTQQIWFAPVSNFDAIDPMADELEKNSLIERHKIRFIIVTDYETVVAIDKKVDDRIEFNYSDFKNHYDFFLPLTGLYEKAISYKEHAADIKACEKLGLIYDLIIQRNDYGKENLHELNIFMTRLLYCFFAEDTGIFPGENQFSNALESHTQQDAMNLSAFFETLFVVLNTPEDHPSRKEFPDWLNSFPYLANGLFDEQVPIPKLNFRVRRLLIQCGRMSWRDISPVIFGSMFQTIMDEELRRERGAHYTSEQNIFKVIRPLFLDSLEEELENILAEPKNQAKALQEYRTKLGALGFLDPACGSGNFLIVAYRELRLLELRALKALPRQEQITPCVTPAQFNGIEILEFPVDVAKVSMLLMQHAMDIKMSEELGCAVQSDITKHANIVCGNALTTPWENVVTPEKLNYILGNPPFAGTSTTTDRQKEEIDLVFEGKPVGYLDYVGCWFMLAARFMLNTNIRAAFVSTNSICQGEQVEYLWEKLFQLGIHIFFAYRTFKWANEAKNNAAVFCVIIGFSYQNDPKFFLEENSYDGSIHYTKKNATNINGYLIDAENIIVKSNNTPLANSLQMVRGNQPTDGGHLIVEDEDYDELVSSTPEAIPYIRKLLGAVEFLHNKNRYCLWLKDAPDEILKLPAIHERLEKVRAMRLASKAASTREYAKFPHLFRQITQPEECDFLLIPSVSSERRKYIPIGYIDKSVKVTNLVHIVPNATLYEFGILTSAMHMAWMRTVCGRLKSDYRYSRDLCYNTFPWPTVSDSQKKEIEALADRVLMVREWSPELVLADKYDPDKMPVELREAHTALDIAVDSLYREKPFENDEERLQLLFQLYEKLVSSKSAQTSSCTTEEDEDA